MTSVLQKYRLVIVILGLLAFISLLWFFLLRQDTNKIPSRGVFVMQSDRNCDDAKIPLTDKLGFCNA